jgi:outer membrane immunogenic protein
MKKRVFTIAAFMLTISTMLSAQVFVSGAFNISTSSSKETMGSVSIEGDKTFEFNFIPKAGYFISEDFAIGLGFGFGTSKITSPKEITYSGEEEIIKENSWIIAPFARYYFARTGELSFFGEASFGIGGGKTEYSEGGVTEDGPKLSMIGFGISPAISYNLSERFAIEAYFGSLGYSSITSEETEGEDTYKQTVSGIEFSVDLTSLYFGAIFKF